MAGPGTFRAPATGKFLFSETRAARGPSKLHEKKSHEGARLGAGQGALGPGAALDVVSVHEADGSERAHPRGHGCGRHRQNGEFAAIRWTFPSPASISGCSL